MEVSLKAEPNHQRNKKTGFVKLFRSTENSWVAERTEWFTAWSFILMRADYETAEVDLTSVKESLPSDAFTTKAWRHFVKKLEDDGMIHSINTARLGRGKGSVTTAIVSNYLAYHHTKDDESRGSLKGSLKGSLNESRGAVYNESGTGLDSGEGQSKREPRGSLKGSLKGGGFKEVKEVKEKPPLTPPTDSDSTADFGEDSEEDETMTTEKQNHEPTAITQADEPTSATKPKGESNLTTSPSSQDKDTAGGTISQNHSGGSVNSSAAAPLPSAPSGTPRRKPTKAEEMDFAFGKKYIDPKKQAFRLRQDAPRTHAALDSLRRYMQQRNTPIVDETYDKWVNGLLKDLERYSDEMVAHWLTECVTRSSYAPAGLYKKLRDTEAGATYGPSAASQSKTLPRPHNSISDDSLAIYGEREVYVSTVNGSRAAILDPETLDYLGYVPTSELTAKHGGR